MQHLIPIITQRFLSRLPEGQTYFSLADLQGADFPSFLVERIAFELENNLADSIVPPKSDWADMKAEPVIAAWEHFLYAIHEATRLPTSFAQSVLETAVEDVLDLLVKPRKNIPEFLFGVESSLSVEELKERCAWLVIHKKYGQAIARYAEKKGLEELSKSRCGDVVAKLDERITASFTPLNWAQAFDDWFTLMGEEIETELLRLFFTDIGRLPWAERFDKHPKDALSRSEIIELLTAPDMNEEDLDFARKAFSLSRERDVESVSSVPTDSGDLSERASWDAFESASDLSRDDDFKNTSQEKATVAAVDEHLGKAEPSQAEEDDDAISLDDLDAEGFTSGEKNEAHPDADNTSEQETKSDFSPSFSFDAQADSSRSAGKDDANLEDAEMDLVGKRLDDESQETETDSKPLDRDVQSEVPLWQRFLPEGDAFDEGEQIDEQLSGSFNDLYAEEEDEHAGEVIDTPPLYDLSDDADEEKSDQKAEVDKLLFYLSDRRDTFIEDLFGGSDVAFNEAVGRIASFEAWPAAGKFITGEIYRENMIDLYSELAIEFIDRIQTYFLENKS